jgi:hypothetical protein
MRCASARRFAIAATALAALLAPAAAQARQIHPLLETFGSAQQPSLAEPTALAVEQSSGDLYAIEGRNEVQQLTVSATAGKFVLSLEGHTTSELSFNVTPSQVEAALSAAICEGKSCVYVSTSAPNTYTAKFREALGTTDVSQLECEAGTPPLSGGSGCSVETTVEGVNGAIRRYHSDGTPAEFSALGSNAIDGRGSEDETPHGGLAFSPRAGAAQVAIDESCALHEPPLTGAECEAFDPANGDVYVTQASTLGVDIFSPAGKYLGQLTEFVGNEEQKLEFSGFGNDDEFILGNLPASCAESQTTPIVYSTRTGTNLQGNILAALEAACGPNFTSRATGYLNVIFTNALGASDQPQLSCTVQAGSGSCSVSTIADGGASTPLAPEFFPVEGVAIDAAGDAYVSGFRYGIHEYAQPAIPHDPLGNADFARNCGNFYAPGQLAFGAGPTAGSLFAIRVFKSLLKLDTSGCAVQYGGKAIVGNPEKGIAAPTTVAVDPASGHVFVGRQAEVEEYDASGATKAELLSTIEAPGTVTGVAVDGSTHDVYLAREGSDKLAVYGPAVIVPDVTTKEAGEIHGHSAILGGEVSAAEGAAAHCSFQYLPEATYLAQKAAAEAPHDKNAEEVEDAAFAGAEEAPCEPAGPFTGASTSAVHGEATSLALETHYRYRLLGENEDGHSGGAALSFQTAGKPELRGGEASEVTTASALVSGEVNPRGLPTSLVVQYVTAAAYEESGFTHATALPAEDVGEAAAFAEAAEQLTGLAPATAYRFRLIAANEAGTATGEVHSFATFAAPPASLPDSRAYEMVSPAQKQGEPFPAETRGILGGSCRECLPGGEVVKMPMQPSADGDTLAYEGQPFAGGFSANSSEYLGSRGPSGWSTETLSLADYSNGVFNPRQPEGFLAFAEGFGRGAVAQSEPALSPLAPAREGRHFANLYAWSAGGEVTPLITAVPPNRDPVTGPNFFIAVYAGADASFDQIVFEANDALTSATATAPAAPPVGESEYDLYQWREGQLSLLNVLPGNATAAPDSVVGSGQLLKSHGPVVDHAVSADGSHVYWTDLADESLYVRIDDEETREVKDPGHFLTATPDGERALLSDGCLYSLAAESCEDLTSGEGGFEGILGASEDLARVYFVDTKVLPGAEANEGGEEAEVGKPNLYLWQGGAATFLARLLPADNGIAGSPLRMGDWKSSPTYRTAQVSPDGRYLAFMSAAPLTGYDNERQSGEYCGATAGAPCEQVFTYDAATAKLRCPSCNPTGARPLGYSNLTLIDNANPSSPLPQPHNLAADGRIFFESQDALSAADQNGAIQDVYEWEPKGVGSCAATYAEGGCVELISTGHSPNDSLFVNATPSGSDAYFVTRQQLAAKDRDDLLDIYDARSGGGFEEGESAPCAGEACKGASPAPPAALPGAASSAFAGPGNAKPAAPKPRCRKGKVRRKGRCVPRHRKHHKSRHRHRKHRRANLDRRARR